MTLYKVHYVAYSTVEVEADSEDEAINSANWIQDANYDGTIWEYDDIEIVE